MKFITLGLLVCLSVQLFAQRVDRIEPPQWWIGMKNPSVQLMVYGERVSELTPQVEYKGVKIIGTRTVENLNYLLIDLEIHVKAKPGVVNIDFYAGRTKVDSKSWSLETREIGSATRRGVDQSDVIYLITPDRFANGDPGNDSVEGLQELADRSEKGGRHGGDLEGIRSHLGYFKDMGFTTIWLNPVLENDMSRSSYHGYSTTDYYKVDPRFGTNDLWRQVVNEGKAIGLKHVMDMIPNHCGSEHWWMQDLPSHDWLNQWDEFTRSNHLKTVSHDPYAAATDIQHFTDGWFVRTMPDLNQRNPYMARYLTQNAIWWVEYLGLAGIRIDTYAYSDPDFLSEYCKQILAEYPDLFIVGEQWHTMPETVAYWQKGKLNKDGYVSYLPDLMDFPLQNALIKSLNAKGGWNDAWLPVYEVLGQDILYPEPNDLMVFPDNHDMSRIFTQVNEDYTLYKLALAFIATTRGIPQLFYGTEILMANPGTDDHVIIRSDFPGGWDGDEVNGFTGEGLTAQQLDAQRYVRTLLNWRRTSTVVHHGRLMHYAPHDNVYVYFRYNGQQKVMVILNKNQEPYTLSLDRFEEMLSGVEAGKDILSGNEYQMHGSLVLDKGGPLILELD
jgi:glycosidase